MVLPIRALGVVDNDLKAWESGMKLVFIRRLKEAQPLLYPQLRDLNEEKVDRNYLLADTEEEHDEPHETSQAVPRPKCTQCQYFPDRKYSDAVKRIYNHAVRCHGELEAEKIREEIIATFGPAARKNKCKTMVCGICQAEIRGKRQNMEDHQNTKKCKNSAEGRTSQQTMESNFSLKMGEDTFSN
ncbi:NADH dehydrogenase [ubiquinone] flavoprotein 2, mitochondrial [Frankliniella fusca]|uniref:NADH dehydrogenase [ubiquinone] flavoprotein 2, mitochondrial n=1 Tax=Frankliniella fusca TaxID=407009 RepID=A0AAE1L6Z0_9NEOP|nr:NADH dehydrogenase [ubiquinone] flavoprotein 2, mitochondrial [Frankliniella fusca]